jgi:uncharacterized protein (TIGR02594 family)
MTPLDYARRELAAGVREATGKNDGIPAQRYNFGECKPWCAAFVAWCFDQADQHLPGNIRRLASVDYMERQLEARGARVRDPEPGDVVTFARRLDSDAGPGRHVGIVEDVEGRTLITIEGNVGDRVKRCRRPRHDPQISGFYRWPAEDAPL